jgi:AcrR family transcriptional regulator
MTPTARRRARQPHQLPPGRHGLPRSFVASNQRDRILDAVADVASLAGYASMSVEGIIATAGVSRRTFYDHFSDKQEAFLAAYDAIVALLVDRVQSAFVANTTFAGRVRDCLAAFLTFLASEPRFADMCIVEVLAAGPEAVERRDGVMKAMAGLIQAAASELKDAPQAPPLMAETIVGGIYEVVYSRVLQGKAEEMPEELQHDLSYSMMLPYIGHAAARREAAKAPNVAMPEPQLEPEPEDA